MADDKIQRMSIAELEARASALTKAERLDEANSLAAYTELRRMLVANAERDLVLAQAELRLDRLENICFDLQVDREDVRREFAALKNEHQALKRQQAELHARQDMIAAVIDVGIERIGAITGKIEALTESVDDITKP